MPSPAEQQRIYTRMREVFGPQWAEQNWPQFAQLLNDPSVGAAGLDEFLSQADQRRQAGGLDTLQATRFEPKQYGLGEGQRELEAAGLTEGAPQLQQQLLDVANMPGGAALVDQFTSQLEQAAEGGFDETEQLALQRMIEGVQRQLGAQQDDPGRFGAQQGAQAFYDPSTAQATPPQFGEELDNEFLQYMDPQHLQDYYQSAVSGASGEDVAGAQLGTDPTKDTIGEMMASMDYYRQQAQQTLQDPDATSAEKQQAQQAIEQLDSPQAQMLNAFEYLGPGSTLDLPGGFDTQDLTAPELTASLQMGGLQQIADPRRWLRGGAGAMAARYLMPDMTRSPAAENIQHPGETSTGFGTGGYYQAPTAEQARENAMQAIRAWEMESGQEMDPQDRATMVQQYLGAAQQNQALEDERIQGFIQNMTESRPAEQAEALLPQAIGRPADFAQQAGAMDIGDYRARRAPAALGRAARRVPGAVSRAARAAGSPMSTARSAVQTGTRAAMQPGAAARSAWRSGPSQALRRIGPLGLATGAMGAIPIGQSQANIAASGTGGPSFGTRATGVGAGGLSMLSTEAALPQAMRGLGEVGRASGVTPAAGRAFGAMGRAMTPQKLRGAGGAFRHAMSAGRAAAGPGAGPMARMGAGARNLATAVPRAARGAAAAFNPAARAQAARAATLGRGMAAAGRAPLGGLARAGQIGRGLGRMGGGAILAQAGIDAALNAGDAYTSMFGGGRGRQMVQQGNRALADEAGQRGFWGNVAAAPNVVSQSRAMMGLNQQATETNRRASGMSMRGADMARQNAQRQAFETAAQQAGLDPSDYMRVRRDMSGDESFFNEYLQADPSLQQAHQLYQQTEQDAARRRGQSGFAFDEGQKLTDYVQDTGNFLSRAFGGGNEGALRSMSEIYQDAPEELQGSMRNLAQAVQRGDIPAQEAAQYLNVGAARDQDELLEQMRAAGML